MLPGKEYTLQEVIGAALATFGASLHFSIPGKVVTYHATTQTADVEPVCQQPSQGADGEVTYLRLPTLPSVPVAWPSGGSFCVAFGMSPGDPVMLVFSETAMGEYLINGEQAKPLDTRRHSLGYPIAVPGAARPDSKVFTDAPVTGVMIGKDGADQQILIDATDIKLGKGATDFVALASKVLTELQAIRTQYNTHVHAVASFGPSAAPTVLMTEPNAVAATIAKAK